MHYNYTWEDLQTGPVFDSLLERNVNIIKRRLTKAPMRTVDQMQSRSITINREIEEKLKEKQLERI